jgi:hypothetical protein
MKRITFDDICEHLWKNYGGSAIARLQTTGGSIVPRTYIHYSSNTIFTMDKELARTRGYKYFEL